MFFNPTFYFNEKSAVQVIFSPLSLRPVGGDLANHLRSNQRAQKALYLCGIYTYTHEMGQHFLSWYNFTCTLKAISTNIYQCYQTINSNSIECYTSEKNIRKKILISILNRRFDSEISKVNYYEFSNNRVQWFWNTCQTHVCLVEASLVCCWPPSLELLPGFFSSTVPRTWKIFKGKGHVFKVPVTWKNSFL